MFTLEDLNIVIDRVKAYSPNQSGAWIIYPHRNVNTIAEAISRLNEYPDDIRYADPFLTAAYRLSRREGRRLSRDDVELARLWLNEFTSPNYFLALLDDSPTDLVGLLEEKKKWFIDHTRSSEMSPEEAKYPQAAFG